MVRKISVVICAFALIMAFAMPAHGATHEVYEGNISSTYKTYAKEILDNYFLIKNYVFFRSGQYEYTLVVDNGFTSLDYSMIYYPPEGGYQIKSDGEWLDVYTISVANGSYNNSVSISFYDTDYIDVDLTDKFFYSADGTTPTIIPRSEVINYAIAFCLCVMLCMLIINRIFFYRKR